MSKTFFLINGRGAVVKSKNIEVVVQNNEIQRRLKLLTFIRPSLLFINI